jgi:rare lipoprotein A
LTANGEVFDMGSISAAHPTLPMPSYVRVTNLRNGRSIIARVNDRGPYAANRLIDVSQRTAKLLGFHDHGLTRVRVEYVGRAPLEGSDDRRLAATLRESDPAEPPPNVMLASTQSTRPARAVAALAAVNAPIPQERPYTLGEDSPEKPARQIARATAPADRHETAQARINRTMGSPPGPSIASIINSRPPHATALVAAPAASAYAPRSGGTAFASGRGLY